MCDERRLSAAQRKGGPPDSGPDHSRVRPDSSSLETVAFASALFCAVALMAVLAAPMLAGKTYFIDDLSWYSLPTRLFYARCLAAGDNFTWIPDIFCGYYLHGEGQAGMCHPLHLLMYRLLPPLAAFNLELFLSYPVALMGMYLLLRRWGIRRSASLAGATMFAFSGFNLLHFMHMNGIATVAHVPWLLLSVDRLVCARDTRGTVLAGACIALLTGSQVLLGSPQYVFLSSALETFYVMLVLRAANYRAAIGVFIAAKILGVALGAVQLFPTITVFNQAERSLRPRPGLMFHYSLDPYNLIQFVAPYLLSQRVFHDNTHEFGAYDGSMTLVLVLWGIFSLLSLERNRKIALAAVVLMLVSLEIAFGGYGALHWVVADMPILNMFRAPARFLLMVQLAMSVLAAISLDSICQEARKRTVTPWRRCMWLLAVPAAAILVAAIAASKPPYSSLFASLLAREAVSSPVARLAGPVLAAAAVAILIAVLRGVRAALPVMIVFAAADQGFYGMSYIRDPRPQTVEAFTAGLATPPDAGPYRVLSAKTYDDKWVLAGCRLANGYAGLWPHRTLDYGAPNVLRVAGVGWFSDSNNWELQWHRVDDPLPRARLVTEVVAPAAANAALSFIDVSSVAVAEGVGALPGGPAGDAGITRDRPGAITVVTSAPSRQLLVVSESYSTGWRVTVDGKPAGVVRVYGDFIGCVVEPGAHTIEFTFRGPGLAVGVLVSGISGLVLVAAVILALLWKPACAK